jgi:hypothetical protein
MAREEDFTMRIPIIAAAFLAAAPAFAVETGTGRFQLEKAGEGFIRLDRETGQVSLCTSTGGTWSCNYVAESDPPVDAALPQSVEDRLTAIEQRLGALEERPSVSLPSDQDVNRALDIFGRFMDRFKDFARDMQGNETTPEAQP